MSKDPDQDLVDRCRKELPYGSRAYESLVRRYETTVFNTCLKYFGNRHDAEEACQDVFLKVFHGLPRFESRARFKTWLFRIVHNHCATAFARRQRRQAGEQRALLRLREQSVDNEIESAAKEEMVQRILAKLSSEDRTALVLRHAGGLTFEELAEVLGVGTSAAKMRLYRAETRFREHFPLDRDQGFPGSV